MATTVARTRTYRVVLEWDEDWPGWVVTVPALPGCVTQGKTEAQALERAQEAVTGYLESLAKHGEPIPPADAEAPTVTVLAPA